MFRVFLNAGTGGYEEVVVIVGDELPRSSCPHILDSFWFVGCITPYKHLLFKILVCLKITYSSVKLSTNNFCTYEAIPESFNTNISHQLFDYTITFVNPQH